MADFLWVVPIDGAKVTLEHCLELMPLLEGLWKVLDVKPATDSYLGTSLKIC